MPAIPSQRLQRRESKSRCSPFPGLIRSSLDQLTSMMAIEIDASAVAIARIRK